MKEIRVPSDVVKSILSFLGAGTIFKANMPNIHSAMYALSKTPKLSYLFTDFIFDESQQYPYSEVVNCAFDNLQSSGLIIWRSDDFFQISDALSKINRSSLFNEAEIKLLRKASVIFAQQIPVFKRRILVVNPSRREIADIKSLKHWEKVSKKPWELLCGPIF